MRFVLLLLALLATSLSGCAGDDGSDDDNGDADGMDGGGMGGGDGGEAGPEDAPAQSILITAEGLYPANPTLSPATFEVAAGTNLTVTFTNNELNPLIGHDLLISGVNEQTPQLDPGETATLNFIVDLEPGEYPYWCAVGNHRDLGMEGVMVVV